MTQSTRKMKTLGKFPQAVLGVIMLPIFLGFILSVIGTGIAGYGAVYAIDPTWSDAKLESQRMTFFFSLCGVLLLGCQLFLVSLLSHLAKNSDILAEAYENWRADVVKQSPGDGE